MNTSAEYMCTIIDEQHKYVRLLTWTNALVSMHYAQHLKKKEKKKLPDVILLTYFNNSATLRRKLERNINPFIAFTHA